MRHLFLALLITVTLSGIALLQSGCAQSEASHQCAATNARHQTASSSQMAKYNEWEEQWAPID